MNDWHDEWWKQLEKTAAEVENFFAEVGEATESAVDEIVDEVSENIGNFLEQFQLDIFEEVDSFIEDLGDVIITIIITTGDEIDAVILEEWENFSDEDFTIISYHQPSAQSHPACINCVNYHGQVYNGNLLVCAMHPYGSDDDNCPDWEKDQRSK